jgi:hypothetical protein
MVVTCSGFLNTDPASPSPGTGWARYAESAESYCGERVRAVAQVVRIEGRERGVARRVTRSRRQVPRTRTARR